jgi:hypothetical protein
MNRGGRRARVTKLSAAIAPSHLSKLDVPVPTMLFECDRGERCTDRDEREGKPRAELGEERHRTCEKQKDRHDAEVYIPTGQMEAHVERLLPAFDATADFTAATSGLVPVVQRPSSSLRRRSTGPFLVRLQRLDVRDKRVQLIVRENAAPVGHAHDRGAAEDAAGADDLLDLRVGVELAEEIRA